MARSLPPNRRRWRRPSAALVFLAAFACSTAAAQMPEERCGTEVSLMSWKGDLLHRPDSKQGVTVWHTGIGNVWQVECTGDGRFRLKSWKGDYLHRPDSKQGLTTWNSGIGNEWTLMQGTTDSSGLGAGAPAMALLVTDTFADGQYLTAARSGGQAVLDIFAEQKRIVDDLAAAAQRNAERADDAAAAAKAYAFEAGIAITAGAVAGGASLWLAGGAGASALAAFATSGAVAGGVGVGVTAVGAAIAAPLVFAGMESAVAVEVLNATDRPLRVSRIVVNHGRQTQGLKTGETLVGRQGGLTPGMIWSFEKNWGLQGIEACIHLEPTDGSWSGTAIWVRVPSTSDNRVGIAANAPDVQRTVRGARVGGRKVTSSRCSITSIRPIEEKASSHADIRAHIGLSNHNGDFPRVIVHIGSTRAPAVALDL